MRSGYGEPPKKLLLPVSMGISSISLLHILDAQLRIRLEQGRSAGYALHLLHVDHSSIPNNMSHKSKIEDLRKIFPLHPLSSIPIEDCFDFDFDIEAALTNGSVSSTQGPSPADNQERLHHMLSAAKSATSRIDLTEIIRRRLIAAFALKHGCDGVLYGDTTTRLAQRTLSETAKGRGGLLPQLTGDCMTGDGIYCCYPMRDLLKKELSIYADITDPQLTPLVAEKDAGKPLVASSKDSTIDGLMRQYFETVEESYPSIVANVVRTTAKLKFACD